MSFYQLTALLVMHDFLHKGYTFTYDSTVSTRLNESSDRTAKQIEAP